MSIPNPLALAQLLDGTLACVCDGLDDTRARLLAEDPTSTYPGCPCVSFVSPGPSIIDQCCGDGCDGDRHGQLTVHVARLFSTNAFPRQDPNLDPCAPRSLVAEVVVRLSRCVMMLDDDGTPVVDPDLTFADASTTSTDMLVMFDAVTCCATAYPGQTRRRARRVAVISHTPFGPTDGCAGSELRAYFDVTTLGGVES